MAALKNKFPRLKSIAGKTDTGGAPFFSEDFVTIQENNRADTLNYFEYLRRLLPNLEYYQGLGVPVAKEFENGIILSGCEYDNTDPSNPVINEGYILSGGEVCYFPGGTFATGPTQAGLIYLFKGAVSPVSRIFDDGFSKEMLVSYNCTVEQGVWGTNGPELPVGTTITATDEVVVISCGNTVAGKAIAEKYFSIQAALNINTLGEKLNRSAFAPVVSLLAGVTIAASNIPYMVSRVLPGGFTEIRGSLNIAVSAMVGSNINLCQLASHNITSGVSINVPALPVSTTAEIPRISVNLTGTIILSQPSGGWPVTDQTIQFNCIIYGSNTLPTDEYSYNNEFLNIT